MANKQLGRSFMRMFWALAIIALLVLSGVLTCLIWRDYRHAVAVANESKSLVPLLAKAATATSRSPASVRVVLFDIGTDDGSAIIHLKRILDAEPFFTWKSVSPADIQAGGLTWGDVVIVPGGSAPKQAVAIGDKGKKSLREFVQAGGGYVGICAGGFLATAKYDSGLSLVNAKPIAGKIDIPGIGLKSMSARGGGIVKMELTDAGRKVLGNFPNILEVRFGGGPIFSPAGMDDLPEYVSLATFRSEIWDFEFQQGTMVNTPAIIASRFGEGRIIIFSPHPETTKGLESLVRQAILATASQRPREHPNVQESNRQGRL